MKRLLLVLLSMQLYSALAQQKPRLVYVADPLCSWCYGFQPEMDKLIEKYKNHCTLQIWVGGMALENKEPLDEESKLSFLEHWKEVNQETGQTFDANVLKDTTLIYNSEPLCRAIVTAKYIDSTKAIYMHKALQKAFYAQNKNVTLWRNIQACVAGLGFDTTAFAQHYHSEQMKAKTQEEFAKVDKQGIFGFPVLLLFVNNKTIQITDGYIKFEQLDKKLKKQLNIK